MSLKIHSVVYEAHIGFLHVIQLHFTIHADNMIKFNDVHFSDVNTPISRCLYIINFSYDNNQR